MWNSENCGNTIGQAENSSDKIEKLIPKKKSIRRGRQKSVSASDSHNP